MPLRIVRAGNNAVLWDACVSTFLEGAPGPGPLDHEDWVWLSHRNLRDRLLDTAQRRGHQGWLDPPITFFGDLSSLFDLRDTPVGLLTRRRILARTAARLGRDVLGQITPQGGGIIRSHVLDSLFADLLPEGVEPAELRMALDALPGDEFTRARNDWIVSVYEAYLAELGAMGRPDWRAVNALLARRIEAGELPAVLRGANRLHVYGITSPRTRRRLLTALAEQGEVEVRLYLLEEPEEAPFFDSLASEVVHLSTSAAEDTPEPDTHITVQPAPDASRELAWVARQVKRLVASGEAEPHEIAIVARSGREDTRRAYRALESAGVPASARIRTPLAEIPALKALMLLFRGAARDWDYQALRAVLDHPLLDTKVDLRGIDFIAGGRRVTGLGAWSERLEQARRLTADNDRDTWGQGLYEDRLAKDIEAFDAFRTAVTPLGEARTEAEWIDLTIRFLRDDRGIFFFRRRLCDPVAERWDIVRLDQRGVTQLERLLREWRDLDLSDEALSPDAWYALLRRLLEGQELAISTPAQKSVQVLEAHDAGLVPFQHTFVVHANDGEFPLRAGSSSVLSDEERVRLAAAGIPVDHRDASMRRERSLWRAVTGQVDGVRVSYRTTNPGGTPLLPSLMVPAHEESTELPRQRRPIERTPVSPQDADELAAHALASALAGPVDTQRAPKASEHGFSDTVHVAPAHPELLRQAIVAAVAESHRGPGLARSAEPDTHPGMRPNPWNGEIRDEEVLQVIAEKFGEDRIWSASQLEGYARIPFQFLLQRVLKVDPKGEAEEETSPLAFGSVAHEILENFYSEHGDPLPTALTDEFRGKLDAIADRVFEARETAGEWLGLPSLWEMSRESMRDAVHEFIEWELPILHKADERPYRHEYSFGYDGTPVFLTGTDIHGRAQRLRIGGRIDRVDWSGDREAPTLHVLDYKSGYIPSGPDYEDGTILQGVLYLEALAGEGFDVAHAKYRSIKKRGTQYGAKMTYGTDKYWQALALALTIPGRIRAGLFEPVVSRRSKWQEWDAPLEIRRTAAQVREGHRFEGGE